MANLMMTERQVTIILVGVPPPFVVIPILPPYSHHSMGDHEKLRRLNRENIPTYTFTIFLSKCNPCFVHDNIRLHQ